MERLLKARSAARGWLTRASKELDDVTQKEGVQETELRHCLREFDKRLQAMDDTQTQVESETEEPDLDSIIDEAFTYRHKHLEIKVRAETLLKTLDEMKDSVSTNSDNQRGTPAHRSALGHARLPKLELPKFSGNYLEFTAFYDKFIAVIDGSDLPAVNKFTYLQSLLTGEALASIKGLSITEESYPVAKEILTQRYGRKERIIFAHIQKLLTLQGDFRKLEDIWRLYDSLQTHVRCLETLGVSGDTYGVILTPLVLSRIPPDIRLEWAREGEGKESDLAFLLDFLYKEIKRQERSQTFQKREKVFEEKKQGKAQAIPSVAAFHAASGGTKAKQCLFCNKSNHSSEKCFSLRTLSADDIRGKVKQLGLCFVCFDKHLARACTSKIRCSKCQGRHNSLLCNTIDSERSVNDRSFSTETKKPFNSVNYAHSKIRNRTTLMQVVKTTILSAKGRPVEVTVLFDGGSDRSFISGQTVQRLNLKKRCNETLTFSGFGGSGPGPQSKRKVYNLGLGGVSVEVVEIPDICANMYRAPVPKEILDSFDMTFTEDLGTGRTVKVDVLIGLDFYWKLVTGDMVRVGSLVAQQTLCGWMLSGEYGGKPANSSGLQLLCLQNIPEQFVRNLWELDNIGITDREDSWDQTMERFNETIAEEGGRYSVALPWKQHPKGKLMNNRSIAEKRLQSLSRRLNSNLELKSAYNEVLREMETSGIIKEVSKEDYQTGPIFYLPHRPVIRADSKTTKVRPVFDASYEGFNGISLNDCLETGPNLLPNLLEILIRFRRWKIAVTGDVKKAFLQIKVRPEDQNVLRFLWDCGGPTRVMVFDRVPFGTKSSPFLLNATIKHHLKKYPHERTVTELENNLYVDDFLSGADTVEEACLLVARAKEILAEAAMDLTKWSSNNESVADTILKEFDPMLEMSPFTKVLGLKWSPKEDCFLFSGFDIPKDLTITKKVVLSFIARLFDPLGFFTPVTITAKFLFQELWELGIDWDDEVPERTNHQFGKWLQDLRNLQDYKIPRSFVQTSWTTSNAPELHVFCDASERGYGCCVYLKLKEDNCNRVTLVMSKAKVAPLKRVTLPRLELLAAVLGARLLHFVQTSLRLPSDITYKCYTDSMITLGWIQSNSSRWKTFVANRVQDIQNHTDPGCWRHCSGCENPSDLVTRGTDTKHLMKSPLWLNGPAWLSSDEDLQDATTKMSENQEEDMATEECVTQCVNVGQITTESVIEISKWSSVQKALRVMGWTLRFVDKCKKRSLETGSQLTNDEIQNALGYLLKSTQSEIFGQELESVRETKSVSKSSSLHKLDPFLDDNGLLRARCRLNFSDLSFDEKFPVILPKCHFSFLLIKERHLNLKHAGVNQIISSTRNQYWIIGLRSLAKRVKRECILCQRIDSRACQEPMAPLMKARLKQAPPFSSVGVDYAGPIFCQDFGQKKFYVLLFTCPVVRAVHLELVESMSLPIFLLAFRKFVSRRGLPNTVFSDNAKTFKSASTELQTIYGTNTPKWRFTVPRAPWWGGWWERMVKNMKSALKKTLGLRSLEKSELETTLAEVEACVNSRPLSFVGDDLESGHPLTPSHFLLGRSGHLTKVSADPDLVSTSEALTQQDGLLHARLDMFWERWKDDYLKQLSNPKRRDRYGNLRVGSVVLLREDHSPRLQWPMGVIEEMIEGKDGIVRTVNIRTKSGSFLRQSRECMT